MKHTHQVLLGCAVAAALLLSACGMGGSSSSGGKGNSGSSSMGSTSGSGSSGMTSSNQDNASPPGALRTGLGVVTTTVDDHRTGKLNTVAAAVLLDADGRLLDVVIDELETSISADGNGAVTMPSDYRTKRQRGDSYPLAAASSLNRSWPEQADAFGSYLRGMTGEQVEKLETDKDGKPTDADLLSGCTIAVETYRDAVVKACSQAKALGAAQGDTLALGMAAVNASSSLSATDDQDVNAEVDVTMAVLTTDDKGHVTSALCDVAEPGFTVGQDGGVVAPEQVRTNCEQGDDYGMRKASALGKEWYEHAEGFSSYLKGKTASQIAAIPDDGSDADLAALCTISTTELQKAVLDALDSAKA